jgi:hypothetical protein
LVAGDSHTHRITEATAPLIGNIFSWLTTALFGVITLALAYESWALLTDHAPISQFIRPAVHSYPGIAFAGAIVIGMLLGHFLWGPSTGRTSPTNTQ